MKARLQQFHRLNAVFLTGFILIHMATHLSGLWGISAYNATQDLFRTLYRAPVLEVILLLSVLQQAGVGLVLMIQALRRGLRGRWAKIQVISGAIFLFFITEHMIAMILARWLQGLDTNFYWPASVMSGAPFTWYFFPYYFLGVAALFTHLGCALRLALLRRKQPGRALLAFRLATLSGVVLALTINAVLLETFYEIPLPPEWLDYLRVFVPGYTQA